MLMPVTRIGRKMNLVTTMISSAQSAARNSVMRQSRPRMAVRRRVRESVFFVVV